MIFKYISNVNNNNGYLSSSAVMFDKKEKRKRLGTTGLKGLNHIGKYSFSVL